MSFQPYSRLAPDHGSADIPLSQFSSDVDLHKTPVWQDAIMSLPPSQKRGCFQAIKGWWLELGSVALAFVVMLVIVVLLAVYNGKTIKETPQMPNLNTIINIFSAIEAGLIAFVAAESESSQEHDPDLF
jgi:negative regulator of sigma E activity